MAFRMSEGFRKMQVEWVKSNFPYSVLNASFCSAIQTVQCLRGSAKRQS